MEMKEEDPSPGMGHRLLPSHHSNKLLQEAVAPTLGMSGDPRQGGRGGGGF
jgi:hypothetical protein